MTEDHGFIQESSGATLEFGRALCLEDPLLGKRRIGSVAGVVIWEQLDGLSF